MVTEIGNMKKITLAVLHEKSDTTKSQESPVLFEMIYGIGMAGLNAFELALEGKKVGDMLRLKVLASQAEEFFGQFFPGLRVHLGLHIVPAEMNLLLKVKEVRDANNSEVVKALAKSGGHSCGGGSCDCGCG